MEGRERLEVLRHAGQGPLHLPPRWTPSADAAACGKIVPGQQRGLHADGPEGRTSLDCLVMDDATAQCTCRKTDAIALTAITECTDVAISHPRSRPRCATRRARRLPAVRRHAGGHVPHAVAAQRRRDARPTSTAARSRRLEDVIWHYNQGGGAEGTFAGTKSPQIRPLRLTDAEVHDLAEFLRSLTGKTPAQQAEEARADGARIRARVWDWTKNTAKPPLPGAGGTRRRDGRGRHGWTRRVDRRRRRLDRRRRHGGATGGGRQRRRHGSGGAGARAAAAGRRGDGGRRYVRALTRSRAYRTFHTARLALSGAAIPVKVDRVPDDFVVSGLEATLCLGSSDSSVPP